MIAWLIAVQLLSFMQLHATDSPPAGFKKRRHYHKKMTFYEPSPLRSSQRSTTARVYPYECKLSYYGGCELSCYCKRLEIRLKNVETKAQFEATTGGLEEKVHTIVHVVRAKE